MKTALLLDGENDVVLEDPMRTSYLEVWTDVGTGGDQSVDASSSSVIMSSAQEGARCSGVHPKHTLVLTCVIH